MTEICLHNVAPVEVAMYCDSDSHVFSLQQHLANSMTFLLARDASVPELNIKWLGLLFCECSRSKARFHVAVIIQINKSVVYFIVRRNVKCGCSECFSVYLLPLV